MIDKLNEILKGIDKDHCEDDSGWWETSSGAKFGAKKLKEVQDLVKKLTLTDVSQQRELLIAFSTKVFEGLYMTWDSETTERMVDEYLEGNL